MKKAVAVKYVCGLPAPYVVGKGARDIALRIEQLAREHGVEVVESAELVDALFVLDVGQYIPEEFFEILAEILAFVYRMRAAV